MIVARPELHACLARSRSPMPGADVSHRSLFAAKAAAVGSWSATSGGPMPCMRSIAAVVHPVPKNSSAIMETLNCHHQPQEPGRPRFRSRAALAQLLGG